VKDVGFGEPQATARGRKPDTDVEARNLRLDRGASIQEVIDAITPAHLLMLQRFVGNQAVANLLAGVPPRGLRVLQRKITVLTGEDYGGDLAAASWATKYVEKHPSADWGKARSAFTLISSNDEVFNDRAELFTRAAEVMEAQKERAQLPLSTEANVSRVAIEIDYYFENLRKSAQVPKMTLAKTYESNWDKKGGFGAEYHPPSDNKWVIHVHRGPHGGLKSARVKRWDLRGEGHNGATVGKFANLGEMGVFETDNSRLH